MPIHDWTRVRAGDFHDFHTSWITHLKESLNAGLLPEGFYAQSEQHAGRTIADILTLSDRRLATLETQGGVALAEAPPQVSYKAVVDESTTYRTARRTLVIRHRSGHQIVAMIEILSPGNKDSEPHLRQFVEKSASALRQGIHLLVIDLWPAGLVDPGGIHQAIWNELTDSDFVLPPDRPLTLAAYLADQLPEAFVEPAAVGMVLREMPLFLAPPNGTFQPPLESTYSQAFRGVPTFVQHRVS